MKPLKRNRLVRPGIRSVFDVKARCLVEGRHWFWEMSTDGHGRPIANIHGFGAVKGARITAVALGRDQERQAHQRWYSACGQQLCVSQLCLRLGTHAQAHAAAAKTGRLVRDAGACARNLAARRQRPDVYPVWMVHWALESQQSAVAVAHALGVDRSTVGLWRRAKKRQSDIAGPFDQLLRIAA